MHQIVKLSKTLHHAIAIHYFSNFLMKMDRALKLETVFMVLIFNLCNCLPLLDSLDLLFINSPGQHIKRLNTVLFVFTDCGNLVHQCSLYAVVKWPSPLIHRLLGVPTVIFLSINLSKGWSIFICVSVYV